VWPEFKETEPIKCHTYMITEENTWDLKEPPMQLQNLWTG